MSQPFLISSEQNPQFKIYKSLLTAKGIKEHRQFFLMGEKLVNEFLSGFNQQSKCALYENFSIQGFVCSTKHPPPSSPDLRMTKLTPELFNQLDPLGTDSPLLLLSYTRIAEKDLSAQPIGLEILCPLGDPKNIGALARSALAFGAQEIILTQEAAHPFLPQSVKASAGAVLKIQFSRTGTLKQTPLCGKDFALDLHGKALQSIRWPQNLRLWIGEEGPGLNLTEEQTKKMRFINIPTGPVESLNAMVSASLAMWEWKKSQT
jgi:TrmH family RNA methyltransferase